MIYIGVPMVLWRCYHNIFINYDSNHKLVKKQKMHFKSGKITFKYNNVLSIIIINTWYVIIYYII